jgi:hypothetical protein
MKVSLRSAPGVAVVRHDDARPWQGISILDPLSEAAARHTTGCHSSAVDETPFLDRYGGQTLSELLVMADTYRVESIILAIEEALRRKPVDELSAVERIVLAVVAVEREVNNGGYNQFFLNEPDFAHEVADSLDQIGCAETARISRDAVAGLGIQPDWTADQISSVAADATDEQDARLGELDDEFFAYPDPITDRLLAYIRQHGANISL